MSDFGNISGFQSMRYSLEVPAGTSPQRLLVPSTGSAERDFALLPDKGLISSYPGLASMTFSAGLDARYCYVGGDSAIIRLNQGTNSRDVASTMEFVIVRWSKKSLSPFPRYIHCVANVRGSTHTIAKQFNEILTAPAVSMP